MKTASWNWAQLFYLKTHRVPLVEKEAFIKLLQAKLKGEKGMKSEMKMRV